MAMDFSALMKARQAWETFKGNHPKFAPFLGAVKNRGIPEGAIITIDVKYPDDTNIKTNVKVTESDLQLLELAKTLMK